MSFEGLTAPVVVASVLAVASMSALGCGSSSNANSPVGMGGGAGGSGPSGGAGSTGSAGANTSPGSVTISPRSANVAASGTQQFTCSIVGSPDGKCTFSVTEAGGGTVSDTGAYSAPEAPGIYHVKATSAADSAQSDTAVVRVGQGAIASCDKLPAAGKWENVTPPEVLAGFKPSGTDFGTFAFATDPVNPGTVYLGTQNQKVWKTTDCGSTWVNVPTGRNASAVNNGVNWTLEVDPIDPQVVYTNSGYGKESNGAYKSKNGGVDWDMIWPPPGQPELKDVVQYGFANVFAIDPKDHLHLLLTFHAVCMAPYNETCLAESKDGGDSWRVINGDKSWSGTEGQVVYFLDNENTWLWASQSNGFWRTENAGASWTQIQPIINEAHPQGSMIYRAKDGTFYLAAADGLFRSTDGKAWTNIPDTKPLAGGIVGDGTTMWFSNNFYFSYGKDIKPYFSAPEDQGAPWTPMESPPGLTSGGTLRFDPVHRLLYSSNFQSGFYRVVVP